MKSLLAGLGFGFLLMSFSSVVADDLTVLTDEPGKQLEALLMRQFYRHLDNRLEAYGDLNSREDCQRWQRDRREFFIRQLGGFPERTPLNANIVGELQGEGYRVEEILFEEPRKK